MQGRLTEGLERSNHNPRVGGSSPSPATNKINHLEEIQFLKLRNACVFACVFVSPSQILYKFCGCFVARLSAQDLVACADYDFSNVVLYESQIWKGSECECSATKANSLIEGFWS